MISFPNSPKELDSRSKTDVQRALPESNPFLKNSYLGALISATSFRVFDFYLQLKLLLREMFVQTATGDFLVMFGAWFGITRNPATVSSGNVAFTGSASSIVPLGTQLQSSDGISYTTQASATINSQVLSITSITRSGSTATATTSSTHNLHNDIPVTIAGAGQAAYNGAKTITVISATQFTFTVTGAPATPATGTITGTATYAYALVKSVDFGAAANQTFNTALTLTTPIGGVDNTARVTFGEISGATDQETDTRFRTRVIERVQNPIALFNVAAITTKAKEIAGVTRVFVQEITPAVGQVTIYFMRDDDTNPIPTGSQVTEVKNKILEIKPANTATADVIVAAPTAVPVNFTFTALSPNTSTMQAAINASLKELFANSPVGSNLTQDSYRSAIYKTVDRETGQAVVLFTLSTPTGDVTITSSQIPTLGTVTF